MARPTKHKPQLKKSLTGLQKRACDIYHSMRKPNKRIAYELAGYQARGKTAKTEAQRVMNLPHVKAYLDSLKEKATERAQRTADEIIAELEKVAFQTTASRNKVRALELLGRRFNLFPNRQELMGKDGGPLQLKVEVVLFGKPPKNENTGR